MDRDLRKAISLRERKHHFSPGALTGDGVLSTVRLGSAGPIREPVGACWSFGAQCPTRRRRTGKTDTRSCARQIPRGALKCRYCGTWFEWKERQTSGVLVLPLSQITLMHPTEVPRSGRHESWVYEE